MNGATATPMAQMQERVGAARVLALIVIAGRRVAPQRLIDPATTDDRADRPGDDDDRAQPGAIWRQPGSRW
ncbi:MAG: hypothetical protein IPL61_18710 [Myxococcales bacterium]|nr:hypothetical protein [Myxococcales bacterium]